MGTLHSLHGASAFAAVYDGATHSVSFTQPVGLDQLSSEDFLTIRLVQVGDEGNVLWHFDFTPIEITLERGRTSIAAGESVRALAHTIPKSLSVTWKLTRDPADIKVVASIDSASGLITVNKESESGYVNVTATLSDNKDVHATKKVHVGCDCEPCKTLGHCDFSVHSVDAVFSVGRGRTGESAGNVFLRSHQPGPEIYTPKPLEFSSLEPGVEALYGSDKALRQVVAVEAFLDVVSDPALVGSEAYELRFYQASGKGEKQQDGFYAALGTPDVKWRIENPAPGTSSGKVRLTETRDGQQTAHEYQWNANSSSFDLSSGNGERVEHHTETLNGTDRVLRVAVEDAHSAVSSVKVETYRTYAFGDVLISEVLDPDGAALTTLTDYYTDPQDPGALGKVRSVQNADGSWVRYSYDDHGRLAQVARPWLDSAFTAPESQAQVTVNEYAADGVVEANDADGQRPISVTELIAGTVVSKTLYSFGRASDGGRIEIEERCASATCAAGGASNLRTVTTYYVDDVDQASNGQVRSVEQADGELDTYSYEYGSYVLGGSFVPGAGKAVRQTVTHGTVSSPGGIANRTTSEVSISDEVGHAVYDEKRIYTGSSYEVMQWTQRSYNARGQLEQTLHSNGELETASWGCCSEQSSTDSRGIKNEVLVRDGLQRPLLTQRAGISTRTVYDADGRVLSTARTGGNASLESVSAYDLAGRLLESIDEQGLSTGYTYSLGGRQTQVTRPGGFTEVTDRYLDGQPKSVTGTAVVEQHSTHGVNGDGTRFTQSCSGAVESGTCETTTTDLLGRTIRVERPGFGGTVEVAQSFYNALGQLVRTSSTGMADTLYQYDELGQQVRSGLDVDGNGQLDLAGQDRVSESATQVVFTEGGYWQETQQSVYASSGVGQGTLVSRQRSRLSGLGGGMVSEQVSTDLQGNPTRSQLYITPSSRTETRVTDVPDSTTNAMSVTVDGRLRSSTSASGVTVSYDYDGLGRRTGVTDPRTGRSRTSYDAQTGRVLSVSDAAGYATTFSYEANTGRKSSECNALGKCTYYGYDARGALVRTWGDVPYPVEYVYDELGRRTEMHTYRTDAGFGTSTWPAEASLTYDATRWSYELGTGLLLSKEDASGKSTSYTYGPAGRLATRTWARTKQGGGALSTQYGYDGATGELTSVDYNDSTPDVSYAYDRLGRQTTVSDGAGSRSFAYDAATLQLTSETLTGTTPAVLTRSYATSGAVLGRPSAIALGSGYTVAYAYDVTGRFSSMSWTANGAQDSATYSYVPSSGLLAGMSTQSGMSTTYGYEAGRDLKTQVSNSLGGSVISQYDYRYDAIGRRTSVENSGSAFGPTEFTSWGYDERNQVTASNRYAGAFTASPNPANEVGGERRDYGYDPIGNRTSALPSVPM